MDLSTYEALWKRLVELSAEALRMTEAEAERFSTNPVSRLVGILPFLAGCEDAERTALSHLAIWVIANRGGARTVFDHRPSDDADPLTRLEPISHFKGGDRKVIDAGMRRLALCMVAGYERDQRKDRAIGAYNPIVEKKWAAAELIGELGGSGAAVAAARGAASSEVGVDEVLSAEAAVQGFWIS